MFNVSAQHPGTRALLQKGSRSPHWDPLSVLEAAKELVSDLFRKDPGPRSGSFMPTQGFIPGAAQPVQGFVPGAPRQATQPDPRQPPPKDKPAEPGLLDNPLAVAVIAITLGIVTFALVSKRPSPSMVVLRGPGP